MKKEEKKIDVSESIRSEDVSILLKPGLDLSNCEESVKISFIMRDQDAKEQVIKTEVAESSYYTPQKVENQGFNPLDAQSTFLNC